MDIKSVLAGDAQWALVQGDCLDVLRLMPDASVDAVVTDPPAGIRFMGKDWDNPVAFPTRYNRPRKTGNGKPSVSSGFAGGVDEVDMSPRGRHAFIGGMTAVFTECLRVLKPGGHALVWALPRTSHWTAMALEDAGFEIRDSLHHIQSQGFPKSLDVGKAIDKAQGAQRQAVGVRHGAGAHNKPNGHSFDDDNYVWSSDVQVTAPATDAAKQWDGWGTALKPSHEIWWLCRKPLDGTVAANTLRHGCGALNIDGCRVGTQPAFTNRVGQKAVGGLLNNTDGHRRTSGGAGRWPTNLLISHSPDCADECVEQCPVAELDRQSGILKSNSGAPFQRKANTGNGLTHGIMKPVDAQGYYGDIGGASRFFPVFRYQSKPSRRERGDGNTHPTVKSIELMRWLCRLVTPPNGVVLDPFAGSGSTGLACLSEGFRFIGIEREAEYVESARRRLIAADTDRLGPLFSSSPAAAR